MARKKTPAKKKVTKKKPPAKKSKREARKDTAAKRSGRGKTGKRTKEQRSKSNEELIEFCARLMGYRIQKHKIAAMLREEAGVDFSPSQISDIFSSARTYMRAKLKINRDDHEAAAIEFCEAIIADPLAANRDKIRAQDQLIDILGLGAKWKINKDDPLDSAQNILDFLKRARAQQKTADDLEDGDN